MFIRRVIVLSLSVFLTLGLVLGGSTTAQAAVLKVEVRATTPTVKAAEVMKWEITWTCDSGGPAGGCPKGSTIMVPIPKTSAGIGTNYHSASPSTIGFTAPPSIVAVQGVTNLRWTAQSDIPAGGSSTMSFSFRTAQYQVYNGDTVTPVATFSASGLASATSQASPNATVTVKTINVPLVVKQTSATINEPPLNLEITYRLNVGWRYTYDDGKTADVLIGGTGPVGIAQYDNAVVTDKLPTCAEYVRSTDNGVYDAATRTVTWPALSYQVPFFRTVTVKYLDNGCLIPDGDKKNPSDAVTNEATVTASPFMHPDIIKTSTSSVSHGFAKNAVMKATVTKGGTLATAKTTGYLRGRTNTGYAMMVDNRASNVPAKFDFTDNLPCAFTSPTSPPNSCDLPALLDAKIGLQYAVPEKLTLDWVTNTGRTGTTTMGSLGVGGSFSVPNPAPGETIIKFRLRGELEAGTNLYIGITGTINPALPLSAVGATYQNSAVPVDLERVFVENCSYEASVSRVDGTNATQLVSPANPICGYVGVDPSRPQLLVVKTLAAPGGTTPGVGTYEMRWRVYNTAATETPPNLSSALIPYVADLLPENLELAGQPSDIKVYNFPAGSAPLNPDNFRTESIPNYANTGRTLLRGYWVGKPGDPGQPGLSGGNWIDVVMNVKVKAGALMGSFTNEVQVRDQRIPATMDGSSICGNPAHRTADPLDLDGDGATTNQLWCRGTVDYNVNSAPALTINKTVRGSLDKTFKAAPAVGLVNPVPGNITNYQLEVKNLGNISLNNMVVYDLLPFVGDTHTGSTDARGSEWDVRLTGPVNGGGGTVQYSTSKNPCRGEIFAKGAAIDSAPVGCVNDWSTTLPAGKKWADVHGVRVDFGGTFFAPAESRFITFDVTAPIGVEGTAWNSGSASATRTDALNTYLTVSPDPVGLSVPIAMSVDKKVSADLGKFGEGDPITYTVVATNEGPGVAVKVKLKDVLPAGLTFVSAETKNHDGTGVNGTYSAATGEWAFANEEANYLEMGQTATLIIKAKINAATAGKTLTNTASMVKTAQQDLLLGKSSVDLVVGGNVGGTIYGDANFNGTLDAGEKGLAGVTVSLLDEAGNPVTYTGVDGITHTFTAITDAQGKYRFSGVPLGSYTVKVDPASPPLATIPTVFGDPDSVKDGQSSITLTAAAPNRLDQDFGYAGVADLAVSKSVITADQITPGGAVSYQIKVKNNGPQDATGVVISDPLPTGLTFVSADGAFAPATGLWTIGTLANGAEATLTIKATLKTGTQGQTLTNLAKVSKVDQYDRVPGNNSASAVFDVGVSIGDLVFSDRNANRIADPGEPGLADVKVTLTYTANGKEVTLTQVTDANGKYLFTGIPAGVVAEIVVDSTGPLASWIGTSDPDTVVDGKSQVTVGRVDILNQNFGFVEPGGVGDFVWFDWNGDGVQDEGEPGASGVTVSLTGTDPFTGLAITKTAATGVDGKYLFAGLVPADYRVSVSVPGGYALSTANGLSVSVSAGKSVLTADFGLVGTGVVGDLVWHDWNADGGKQVSESSLEGVSVTATWFGFDGVLDSGDDREFVTTTAADGSYKFTKLPPGKYQVVVSSVPVELDQNTADPDGGKDSLSVVELAPGAMVVLDQDFGFAAVADLRLTKSVSNTGRAASGKSLVYTVSVVNDGPSSASNVKVLEPLSSLVSFVSAEASVGGYDAASGVWTVGTLANQGTATLKLTVKVKDEAVGKAIVNTAEVSAVDQFDLDSMPGNKKAGEDDQASVTVPVGYNITSRVYLDLNANGTFDGSDTPVDRVKVTLSYDDNGVTKTVETLTDAQGSFTFGGVPDGAKVRITVDKTDPKLAGTTQTEDPDDTKDSVHELTVSANVSGVNFGYVVPASVGDYVWLDLNGDGVQDEGEPAAVGVTVTLTGTDTLTGAAVSKTAVTGADGKYVFAGLLPATYQVAVTVPGGMSVVKASVDVALAAGDQVDTVDFGLVGVGVIGDRVWRDWNADGVQGDSESGLAGVSVVVTWAGPDGVFDSDDDVAREVVTDDSGAYRVVKLFPGEYRVRVGSGVPVGLDQVSGDPDATKDGASVVSLSPASMSDLGQDFGFTAVADLSVAKVLVDLPDWPAPGSKFGYRLTVTNAGPSTATSVTVTDRLPAGLKLVSVPTGYDAASGVWTVGTLASGASAVLDLEVEIVAGSEGLLVSNTAQVATVDQFDKDSTPGNNVAAEDDQAAVAFRVGHTVGTKIWQDTNGNGVIDEGEAGIEGVKVTLLDKDGKELASTTTDANGNYSFTGIPSGTEVQIVVDKTNPAISGWLPIGDPDRVQDSKTTLTVTGNNNQQNFGYVPPAKVTGTVTANPNANGITGIPMVPLPGVTVTLTGKDPLTGAVITKTTTTDTAGGYSFGDLPPGDYQVTFTVPAGYQDHENAAVQSVKVPAGSEKVVDLRLLGLGKIGHLVWHDLNADGIADPGEPGLPQVKVSARWFGLDGVENTSDDVQYDPPTDAQGDYWFTQLLPGTYRVWVERETVPPLLDQVTGDPDSVHDAVSTVTLGGTNMINDQQNFGFMAIADLEVVKTGVADPAMPGGQVTYAVTVTNHGPSVAEDVQVVEKLPVGLGEVTTQPGLGAYDSANNVWTIPQLKVGASATLTVTGKIMAGTEGQELVNEVSVTSPKVFDPNDSNNDSKAAFPVSGKPEVAKPLPKTGFDTPIWAWVASLSLLLVGVGLLVGRRRRQG